MRGNRSSRTARRRGSTLFQAILSIVVMIAISSLAVDVGLFMTAKAELQRAADAASLAAAAELDSGGTALSASAQAVAYAQANAVNAETIASAEVTVTYGGYDAGAFVPNASPVTAVCVKLRRTAADGNAIHLFFAGFVGVNSVDLHATSVTKIHAQPPYKLVGIDHATFGSLGVLANINGRFVSNGDVSVGYPLGLSVGVTGEARSWGGVIKKGTLATISGSVATLTDKLEYDSVAAPAANDNVALGSALNGSGDFTVIAGATVPAGTYVVRDLNILTGIALRLGGPVTFYVTRDFNIAAGVNLLGSTSFDPDNFKVRVLPGGHVFFLASILSPLNMDLYAPDSPITIAVGVSAYKGRLVGKTLDILLPVLGQFTEDQTLADVTTAVRRVALALP